MKLSERLRPDVECAPWVIEEVKLLEKEVERLSKVDAEPTCKKDLQVWVTDSGQFSWEQQDERYWTKCVPASALAAEQAKVRELVGTLKGIAENATSFEDGWAGVLAEEAIAKYGEQK